MIVLVFAIVLLLTACSTSKNAYLKRRKTKKNCNCPSWGMIQNNTNFNVRTFTSL